MGEPAQKSPVWALLLLIGTFSLCCGLPLAIVFGGALAAAISAKEVGLWIGLAAFAVAGGLAGAVMLSRRGGALPRHAPTLSSATPDLPEEGTA